jgi:L-ascorbate metabolism protein UlaG (beta-lactamase superfamily)
MKITKYVHSCLLVETPDRVGIIDPGNYSWESGLFDVDRLERLDDIMITHEHPDHMYLPFVRLLVQKFPSAKITTTKSAAVQLRKEGIDNIGITSYSSVELFTADHETMEPLLSVPANTGVHYLGQITHPGDSHHFDVSKDILALPITAPWGTVARAAQLGKDLKPKYVIPIHDWHYKDEARLFFYDRLADFFSTLGINFMRPIDGKTLELE